MCFFVCPCVLTFFFMFFFRCILFFAINICNMLREVYGERSPDGVDLF